MKYVPYLFFIVVIIGVVWTLLLRFDHQIEAKAIVTDVYYKGIIKVIEISYMVGSDTIISNCTAKDCYKLDTGDTIKIKYAQNHPNNFVIMEHKK